MSFYGKVNRYEYLAKNKFGHGWSWKGQYCGKGGKGMMYTGGKGWSGAGGQGWKGKQGKVEQVNGGADWQLAGRTVNDGEACRHWNGETGSCRYGAKCKFRHGYQNVRKCRNWDGKDGSCKYGDKCTFRHEVQPAEVPEKTSVPKKGKVCFFSGRESAKAA